ncbi:MAG: hypothetical protein ACRDRG_03430 [Pseudonocardiaceae bacterium]
MAAGARSSVSRLHFARFPDGVSSRPISTRLQTVVVLVTTEREHHEPDPVRAADPLRPSTIDMARALAADDPAGVMRHLHYPDADGAMVHQLNFAARSELARLAEDGVDARRVWVAVYNADSRPPPATLDVLADLAGGAPQSEPRIMQQSAVFTTNLRSFPPGVQGRCWPGRRCCSPVGRWRGRFRGYAARHGRPGVVAGGGRGWRTAWGTACSSGAMSFLPREGCRLSR